MATTDFTATMTDTMTDAVAEMQDKMQEAYDKSTGMVTEMTDFAKGNVDAVVESGKVLAAGVQDMSKHYAEEAKTVYETVTADMKEMASVKSPTELFQLQGKILRRNFDMMVANSSKSTDALMKLANDTVAPITGRVNIAAEKMANVG
jgi:phasin family protein